MGLFDPVFDTVEPSAGLTLTVPGLLVLTAVAVVAAVRPRRESRHGPPDDAAVLRPFLLGAGLASLASLSIAFISQRYLSDVIPLLVVGGAGGLALVDRWAAGAAEPRQRRRVHVAVGALVAVTAFGVVTNVAVTWLFQRVESPKDPATRVSGVRTRLAAHDLLGLDAPPTVRSATFVKDAQERKILIVGDCKAMYWGADNGRWFPMEVGRSAGHHRLGVRLDGSLGDEPVPLLSVGSAEQNVVIAVEALPGDGDRARLIAVQDGRVTTVGAATIDVDDLRDADLDVWLGGPGGTVDLGGISVSEGERFTGDEREPALPDRAGARADAERRRPEPVRRSGRGTVPRDGARAHHLAWPPAATCSPPADRRPIPQRSRAAGYCPEFSIRCRAGRRGRRCGRADMGIGWTSTCTARVLDSGRRGRRDEAVNP